MKKYLFSLFIFCAFQIHSQSNVGRTCGTQILPQQFETWLNGLQTVSNGHNIGGGSTQSIYYIPVIVHVIHNNENVNSNSATSGNNISAAQVQDQINILNKDYGGTNSDTTLIPTVFKPARGKFNVVFCLAVVNPTGGVLAEPGIDRINRVSKGWTASPYTQTYIDGTIKPNSIWDPTKYLNMWVCALGNSLLGYATFPNPGSSGVLGLSSPFGSSTTDGVVILNTAFGSVGTAQSGVYNKGRTVTHEIGHWMGLRHIWGDGTCATDYCNDTPPAQSSNFGCPTYPYHVGTCSGNTTGEMTMNFMDYTDDACMYMFTKDQKNRAQLILTNSTMRAALITSTVCNLPSIGTDAGISNVLSPSYSQALNCPGIINPIINITNYGTTNLISANVAYNIDGVSTQNYGWTGSIAPNTTSACAMPSMTITGIGAHAYNVVISAPNGTVDANASNNNNVQSFVVSNNLPLSVLGGTTCPGNPISISVSGAVTYSWSNGSTSANPTVTPSANTIYTVTGYNGGCNATATVLVVVQTLVVVTTGGTTCPGVPINISASGATSYSWSTGATNANPSVNPASTTIYTVTGYSGNCIGNATVAVYVQALPTVTVNNKSTCENMPISIIASGAPSYSWSTGSFNNSINVNLSSNTTYTVTGFNSPNCFTNYVFTVSVHPLPSSSIQATNLSCASCSDATITVSASGGSAPYTYAWIPSGGNASQASNVSAGCYTVTITDNFGCKNQDTACVNFDVGINEKLKTKDARFKISPNPSSGKFVLEVGIGSAVMLEITDALGRLIKLEKIISPKQEIDLSTEAKGIYYLKIYSEKNSEVIKLMKE